MALMSCQQINEESYNNRSINCSGVTQCKMTVGSPHSDKCYSGTIDLVRQGKSSKVKNQLNLKLDKSGILRCHGRMENTELTQGAKQPKLLPKDEYFTQLVIEDHHHRILHSGISQTLAQIQHEYWIRCGHAVVKKVLKDCRIC